MGFWATMAIAFIFIGPYILAMYFHDVAQAKKEVARQKEIEDIIERKVAERLGECTKKERRPLSERLADVKKDAQARSKV